MLDDTDSSYVTSTHDVCKEEPCSDDVISQAGDVTDDVVTPPAGRDSDVSRVMADEADVADKPEDAAADISSTSSADGIHDDEVVTSPAADVAEAGMVVKSSPSERFECKVCGDDAAGMYFGARVCVPCKTFFLRYAGDGEKFRCKYVGSCDVTVATRTHCKCCRYAKCLLVGMRRRVRPAHVEIAEGQQLCAVCSDVGNGIHFGVVTCEGCKKFFRRGLVEFMSYRCKNEGQCMINPRTRNLCRYCRYQRCLSAGMSRTAIQMGRPTKYTSAGSGSGGGVKTGAGEMSDADRMMRVPISSSSSSSGGGGGGSTMAWYSVPSCLKSLLHHGSVLPATGIVNRWLVTVPDVSTSPDSTVKEVEQSSSDRAERRASDASQSVTVTPAMKTVYCAAVGADERSQLKSRLLAGISMRGAATSGNILVNYREPSKAEVAAVRTDMSSIATLVPSGARQLPYSAFNLSSRPVDQHHPMSSSATSPTVTSLVLAAGCDTEISEECRSVDPVVDVRIDRALSVSLSYWLQSSLQDTDDLFIGHHWDVINAIVPVYDRFVHHGTCLNRDLKEEFEDLCRVNDSGSLPKLVPAWIKGTVIPAYTVASVNYFQSLPGFKNFDAEDQATLIRLGQSASRAVLAAVHWYDVDLKLFRNFLSWRSSSSSQAAASSAADLFKKQLVDYAESISPLELDPIEAALLNSLLIIATDYPHLRNKTVIEEMHTKILYALQAYTAAKYGTPNGRLKMLFSCIPYARRLGLLHYQMTRTGSVSAEEVATKSLLSAASGPVEPTCG